MLYTAHLFCPCRIDYPHVYDEEGFRPCIGLCGHTVCLFCIKNNVHMSCPICNQPDVFVNKTPNYAAIELINDRKNNCWQLIKNWWSGESINSGPCSRCSDQSLVLRICLTCDENNLCIFFDSERRLKMDDKCDLLKLSRHVLCSDCAINHHNGHQTINIEKIKYSQKDIKTATPKMTMYLFLLEMVNLKYTTKCRLRYERIDNTGEFIQDMLRELDYKEEEECGYLGELIKMELITKYIQDIDRKREELMLFSVQEAPCECIRLYNELTGTRTKVEYKHIFSKICDSGIGMFSPGCPLFLKRHSESRLKLYEMIGETPPEQVTPEPYNVLRCPLCVILDHSEHNEEHPRQNWLEIVENIWKNKLPPLSEFCFRCLDRLNNYRIGSSCECWEDKKLRLLGDHPQRYHDKNKRYLDRHPRNPCYKPDCLMKDPKLWKYHIISEIHAYLWCIMRLGCLYQNFSCQLKKIRLESSTRKAFLALGKIDLRKNSREEFNLILKNVDDAFEQLKNRKTIYEAEIQGPKCKCSKLWNKNLRILKMLVEEGDATREPYLEFKRSMEEMTEFSLKEEIPGCPMDFDHGIVLDPIVLEELKVMDLEDSFENMKLDSDPDSGSDTCFYNYINYWFNSQSFNYE